MLSSVIGILNRIREEQLPSGELLGSYYFSRHLDMLIIYYRLDFMKNSGKSEIFLYRLLPEKTLDVKVCKTNSVGELLFGFDIIMEALLSVNTDLQIIRKADMAKFLDRGILPEWAEDPVAAKLKCKM